MQRVIISFQAVARGFMQRRQIKKKLFRHEAIGIIQENLIAFSKVQKDPWWQLYMRMRPLLTTARAAEEEKAKKAAIAAMEAKVEAEVLRHRPYLIFRERKLANSNLNAAHLRPI
jgi:myosin heavy chain 9/10/11/14